MPALMATLTTASAFAPASVGNFAAGFDVLGAALAPLDGELLGDVVTAELADRGPSSEMPPVELRRRGAFRDALPPPADDLVLATYHRLAAFLAEAGRALPPLVLTLDKNLPVASGLGSSASSIVATLVALDALAATRLSRDVLLQLAGEVECRGSGSPHLDNVAPSLLGGLQLVTGAGRSHALPFPPGYLLAVVSPELQLATAAARAALPAAVPLATAVVYGQNLAALVHALHAGDPELLRASLWDPLAEPHRAPLVPGFRPAQAAALAAGAVGCTLSGSGPAIFALAAEADAAAVARAVAAAFAAVGVASRARLCALDRQGARLLAREPA
jgi:homoserine kinase